MKKTEFRKIYHQRIEELTDKINYLNCVIIKERLLTLSQIALTKELTSLLVEKQAEINELKDKHK